MKLANAILRYPIVIIAVMVIVAAVLACTGGPAPAGRTEERAASPTRDVGTTGAEAATEQPATTTAPGSYCYVLQWQDVSFADPPSSCMGMCAEGMALRFGESCTVTSEVQFIADEEAAGLFGPTLQYYGGTVVEFDTLSFEAVYDGGDRWRIESVREGPANQVMQRIGGAEFKFASISVGGGHACGLRDDGSVQCWGEIDSPPEGEFLSVSSELWYSCGVRTGGSISCWGSNDRGQTDAPEGEFTLVDAGTSHACAVSTTGSAVCWGDRENGKATPPEGTFSAVSAGGQQTCGLRTDGSITCWGREYIKDPRPPEGEFVSISVGPNHACALSAEGPVLCWGENDHGRATPPDGSFISVSAGRGHTCAVRTNGTVACWGSNNTFSGFLVGQSTAPDGEFRSVSANRDHTCGVRADGRAVCWGNNEEGQASPPGAVAVPATVSTSVSGDQATTTATAQSAPAAPGAVPGHTATPEPRAIAVPTATPMPTATLVPTATPLPIPDTPENVWYSREGPDIRVSWDAVEAADYYNVYYDDFFDSACSLWRDGNPSFCEELAANVSETTYLHTRPSDRDNYYWVVACANGMCSEIDSEAPAREVEPGEAGPTDEPEGTEMPSAEQPKYEAESGAPDVVVEFLLSDADRTPPRGSFTLSAKIRNQGQARASWLSLYWLRSENPDIAVEDIDDLHFALTTVGRLDASEASDETRRVTAPPQPGTYFYAACAQPEQGEAATANNCSESLPVIVESGTSVPSAPSSLEVTGGKSSSATIRWTARVDADNQLHRSLSAEGGFSLLASNIEGETYLDDGLQSETTYYYRMRACNEVGCSQFSQPVGVITEAEGPVDVPDVPTRVLGHKVDRWLAPDQAYITWDMVEGATYYEVHQLDDDDQRTGTRDAGVAVIAAPLARYLDEQPNRWLLSGGFAPTSYAVKSCNKAGCSAPSNEVIVR